MKTGYANVDWLSLLIIWGKKKSLNNTSLSYLFNVTGSVLMREKTTAVITQLFI